jgi:hypothetical protein
MKEELLTDALLREFLLGKVNDEEREQIESLFLTDAETREKVLAIEQDLIEDYFENSLTQEDKERFLILHAQTDEQRSKLRITKSIKDWAITEARTPQTAVVPVSLWSRLLIRLRLKPAFLVPIAVMIVIAFVFAIVWLNSQIEQRRHAAVEQELAQLNSPASLKEEPPQMIFLKLRPVAGRSIEPQTELKTRADLSVVELGLPWIREKRYATYQAEVRRVGDDESFTIPNLEAQNADRNLIRIRLYTDMLSRGHYQILLRGVTGDGTLSQTEEYTFSVGD